MKHSFNATEIPALPSISVTVLEVIANSIRLTRAVLTADQRVKTKGLRQTDITVRSSNSWWTDTLTTDRVTETTGTLTA